MQKQIEKQIQTFIEGIGGITRSEMMNGTLYIKLDQEADCDFIHTELRQFYREFINPEGGVNMNYVGDEFAFDFVPEDRENKNGVWSEFAEEELLNNIDEEDESPAFPSYNEMPDEVDTILNLEAEAREGK